MGWFIKKNFIAIICFFLSLFLSCTEAPTNPFAKDKTTATMVIHSSPTLKALGGHLFTDTLGAVTQLGIASNLMINLDTVQITIVSAGAVIDTDAIITNFADMKDTAWVSYAWRDTGTKIIYSKACVHEWNTFKDTAFLTVYARPNHPPRISVSGALSITAGTLCSLSVVASDPDAGQTLLYSIGNGPSGAQFDTISKIFKWTPGIADTGTDTILFKVIDNGFPPLADSQKVAVSVFSSKVNHTPKWQINTVNENAIIGTALKLTLSDMCSDQDGDSLSLILIDGAPSRDTITNGIYSWTPLVQDTGSYSVHIVVKDPQGLADTLLMHLTVNATAPINHKPVLIVSGVRNIKTGTTCILTVSATDPDSNQTLTYSLIKQPAGATFGAGLFTWTPPVTFRGVDTAAFVVTDNGVPPKSDTAVVQITVSDSVINRPPKWAIDSMNLVTTAGTALNLTLSDKCSDPDGDTLSFSLLSGNPVGDSIKNKVYSFSPLITDTGSYWPQIIAKDPKGLSDTLQVHLTVSSGDNTPPTLSFVKPVKDTIIGVDSFAVSAVCKDQSGIASLAGLRDSTTFTMTKSATVDSLWTGTAKGIKAGQYSTIMLIATDASASKNKDTVSVRIKYDSDVAGPTIAFQNNKDSGATNASSYTITLQSADASGVLSVNAALGASPVAGARAGSNWTITVNNLSVGMNTVVVTATDSSLRANKTVDTFYVKYDPTMLDTIGPTITQVSGPHSGDIVSNSSVTIVDSISDPSGVDSVYWTLNHGAIAMVSASSGRYSIAVTLSRENLDTIVVTAVDKSTKRNHSTQTIVLNYVVAPQITFQPASQAVCAGSRAIFSVTATGTQPLNYKWSNNVTSPACTLNNVTAAQNKTILSCVVSNAASASVTSSPCTLTVNTAPVKPTNVTATPSPCCPNDNVTLSATGASLKWYASKTGTALASSTVNPASTSWYFVLAEGTCGNSAWDSVQVTVNSVSIAPTGITGPASVSAGGSVTLTVSGGSLGTNASWKWYMGSCGGTAAGNGTSITPTISTTTTYYVRAEGGCQTTACASLQVTAIAAPSGLSYTTPVTYWKGVAITANTPTVTGTVDTFKVSPALPAGLTINQSTGIITGTPTVDSAAAATYTVTAKNIGGSTTATISITVKGPPSGLSYTTPVTYCTNTSIAANAPAVNGTILSYSVNNPLPAGLSLNSTTGIISGTPTAVSGTASYTVIATNPAGTSTAQVTITVNSPPSIAPTFVSPKTDSNGVPINTTLSWNSVSGAVSYSLQVSGDAGFTTPVVNVTGLTGTSRPLTTELSNSTRYYWRVCAVNQCGPGPWTTDSFITYIKWTSLGQSSESINSIAGGGNNNLFIGTSGGVFRSTNNGDSWTQTGSDVTSSTKICANGANVFAVNGTNIYISANYGTTWDDYFSFQSMVVADIALSGTNIYGDFGVGNALWASYNSGTGWVQPTCTGLNGSYGRLAANGNDVFSCVKPYGTTGLYRSQDKGNTWSLFGFSGNSPNAVFVVNNTIFAATNSNGIYFNNGTTWVTGTSSPNNAVDISGNGTKIIAGSDAGVYFSSNGGQSWVLTDNLTGVAAQCVCVYNGYIFVGTGSNGLFRSHLP